MTLSRVNVILAAVLVVQAIVVFALPKQGAATKTGTKDANVAGRKPFAPIEAKDVRGITITSGEGKTIRLAATVKQEGGQDVTSWAIADRDGFPARTADVEKIIDAAKKIELSRVITRQPKRYARLNVADGVTHARVQITGEGGAPLADFRIGESKDFSSVYVRMEHDDAVYEATGPSTWEFPTTVSGLVDATFVDAPLEQVARVKLTSATEMFDIVKEIPPSRPESAPADTRTSETTPASMPESGPATRAAETKPEPKWVVASNPSRVLDKTKVESWIRGLTRINLGEPIGKEKKPEYGFDKPTATATLVFSDGKEIVLTVGAERKEERDYYFTATGKDFVVTIASWNVTDQFQKKLADLEAGSTPAVPGPDDHEGHDHR
jgi:hypothetical protein